MQVKTKLFNRDFEFDLDEDQIVMKSVKNSGVVLPYRGELPEWTAKGRTALLCLDIRPFHPKVYLQMGLDGWKPERFKLEYDNKDILDIMYKFFNNGSETGLSAYWRGLWNAHFVDWYEWIKFSK